MPHLTDVKHQMTATDIYSPFHPNTKYSFFSETRGTLSKTDDIVKHSPSLNRYKKTELTPASYQIKN